jgi:protein-S-isoprenylcysteine O-methyltransferase Ste14
MAEARLQPPRDASSRVPWPPIIYGAAFLAGLALHGLYPLPFAPESLQRANRVSGIAILILAALVGIAAEWKFFRAGTATLPTSPTTALVTTGIYGWSRNPMYLAMSLGLSGFGLLWNDLWFLLALPAAMYAVTKLAIEPEEAYLTAKFGAQYREYCRMVGRWL